MASLLVVLGTMGSAWSEAPGAAREFKQAQGEVRQATAIRLPGGHIATRSLIALADGTQVWLTQPGGDMSGFRTTVFPSLPLLRAGQHVEVSGLATPLPSGALRLHATSLQVTLGDGDARLPFVSNTSSSGNRLYWAANCIYLGLDEAGTTQLAGELEFDVIQAALDTWTDATASCSYLTFIPERIGGREVAVDGVNLIKFRDTKWCVPATADAPEECLLPAASALTWLQSVNDPTSDRDGEIVDADIQINGVNFAIAHNGTTLGAATCQSELSNVITHELGHLLGLGHTCRLSGEEPAVDHLGNPVPLCTQTADPDLTEATMAAGQECGDVNKNTLEADDIAAICANYAAVDVPATCERANLGGKGCCSASGGSASILLGLVVLARLRRRGR
ncbi:MAG: hypothetical protein IPL79_00235 [Myxococcales bacterium]|nr:hypothetical protein [Myxococcales bacterium]